MSNVNQKKQVIDFYNKASSSCKDGELPFDDRVFFF